MAEKFNQEKLDFLKDLILSIIIRYCHTSISKGDDNVINLEHNFNHVSSMMVDVIFKLIIAAPPYLDHMKLCFCKSRADDFAKTLVKMFDEKIEMYEKEEV